MADELRQAALTEMNRQGMSQSTLAQIVEERHGPCKSTVARWLSGAGNASDKTINAVFSVLGLKIKK